MFSELEAHPGLGVSIDAGKLEYISSAGLRVLMKLLGRTDEKLTVSTLRRRSTISLR